MYVSKVLKDIEVLDINDHIVIAIPYEQIFNNFGKNSKILLDENEDDFDNPDDYQDYLNDMEMEYAAFKNYYDRDVYIDGIILHDREEYLEIFKRYLQNGIIYKLIKKNIEQTLKNSYNHIYN